MTGLIWYTEHTFVPSRDPPITKVKGFILQKISRERGQWQLNFESWEVSQVLEQAKNGNRDSWELTLSALQNTQKIQQRAAPDTLELEVRWDENKKD